MEEDNQLGFEFPGLGRRKIEANFAGGQVSTDGGVMLLRQVDRWLGFTKQLDRILPDRRNPLLIQHSQESLLRQRIYGLALGYEDLNDHDSLRHDLLWQTATDRTEELGSCSTLCRLENRIARAQVGTIRSSCLRRRGGSPPPGGRESGSPAPSRSKTSSGAAWLTSTANFPMVLAPAPVKKWRLCPRCLPAFKKYPNSLLLVWLRGPKRSVIQTNTQNSKTMQNAG